MSEKKMRAVVLTDSRKVEVLELDVPKIRPGWILTKPIACGICGSDHSIWDIGGGFIGTNFGHEYCLEVVDPGDSSFSAGQRVTALPTAACLECPACLEGRYNICPEKKPGGKGIPGPGIEPDGPGAMSEFFLVRTKCSYPVPDNVPSEVAALSEPFSFAISAVTRRPNPISPGEKVLVTGAGVIGTLVCEYLKHLGAYVGIIDINNEKCQYLIDIGIADEMFNSLDPDVVEKIKKSAPSGWDSAYECSGKGAALNVLTQTVKHRGVIVQAGITIGNTPINTYFITLREYEIYGVFGSSRQSYEKSLEYMAKYPDRLARYVVKPSIPLEDAQSALEEMDVPGNVKLKYMVNPQLRK